MQLKCQIQNLEPALDYYTIVLNVGALFWPHRLCIFVHCAAHVPVDNRYNHEQSKVNWRCHGSDLSQRPIQAKLQKLVERLNKIFMKNNEIVRQIEPKSIFHQYYALPPSSRISMVLLVCLSFLSFLSLCLSFFSFFFSLLSLSRSLSDFFSRSFSSFLSRSFSLFLSRSFSDFLSRSFDSFSVFSLSRDFSRFSLLFDDVNLNVLDFLADFDGLLNDEKMKHKTDIEWTIVKWSLTLCQSLLRVNFHHLM